MWPDDYHRNEMQPELSASEAHLQDVGNVVREFASVTSSHATCLPINAVFHRTLRHSAAFRLLSAIMYMDNFLEQLNCASAELTRQFKLMQTLDDRAKQLVLEADQKAANIMSLKSNGSIAPAEILEEMKAVKETYGKAICLTDDKCLVAEQVYDMIDKYVKKLDAKLVHFKEDIVKSLQESEQEVPPEFMKPGKPAAKRLRKILKKYRKPKGPAEEIEIGVRDLSLNDDAVETETDPKETLFCSCRRVRFGSMVACDKATCEVKLYHFECVQLSEAPTNEWTCPKCLDNMKAE